MLACHRPPHIPSRSISTDRPDELHIIDLSRARIHRLEQLVNLFIRHLLAQIRQDVPQLAHANEARHILVEDLEPAAVVRRVVEVAEPARAVEDAAKGVEINCKQSCVSALFSAVEPSARALSKGAL